MKVKLGQKARDTISGVEGVAVARTEWMYGCVRITVQPEGSKDGKPYEFFVADEPQLVAAKAPAAKNAKVGHGPHPDPQRQPDPTR